jgi:uncharacterized protein (TIGR03067 family)
LPKEKAKPADLVGRDTVVGGEKFGKKEPEARIKGTTVVWSKDTVIVTDAKSKKTYAATYKLDTSSKPWKITMKSTLAPTTGEVAKGLVEKKGDTVRLVYAEPGGKTPASFKTRDKQLMFVTKAVGKK